MSRNATAFEMSLTRCSCGHLDIEHQLMLRPDFTPIGAGACNVCDEGKCPAFVDPNHDTRVIEAATRDKQQRMDMIVNQAQMAFVQKMVDDPEFYYNIQRIVLVNRTNFLNDYLKALQADEEKDYEAIVDVCTQAMRDVVDFARMNKTGLLATLQRWKLLVVLRVTRMVARHILKREQKDTSPIDTD